MHKSEKSCIIGAFSQLSRQQNLCVPVKHTLNRFPHFHQHSTHLWLQTCHLQMSTSAGKKKKGAGKKTAATGETSAPAVSSSAPAAAAAAASSPTAATGTAAAADTKPNAAPAGSNQLGLALAMMSTPSTDAAASEPKHAAKSDSSSAAPVATFTDLPIGENKAAPVPNVASKLSEKEQAKLQAQIGNLKRQHAIFVVRHCASNFQIHGSL